MSDDTVVADMPTVDAEPAPPQPTMSGGGGGGGEESGAVPPEGAESSDPITAFATTMQGSTATNDAGRTSGGRTSGNQHVGRGRNSNDRGGGGRIPMGGRGLVMGARSGQHHGRGYGRGYNQPQQRMPMQVHANSGVPFGHVPAYLPGSSSLVEELDQRILLVLRDGKHIIGTLISFDQFGNLVLSNAIDRQIVSVLEKGSGIKRNYYADLPLDGLYIARGESLVLVGEVHDESNNILMQPVTLEELGNLSANALPSLEWDFDTDLTA